jgi:hypothetical protein
MFQHGCQKEQDQQPTTSQALQLTMTVTAEEEDTTEQQDKWIDSPYFVVFGQLASFNDFIFSLSLGLTNES